MSKTVFRPAPPLKWSRSVRWSLERFNDRRHILPIYGTAEIAWTPGLEKIVKI